MFCLDIIKKTKYSSIYAQSYSCSANNWDGWNFVLKVNKILKLKNLKTRNITSQECMKFYSGLLVVEEELERERSELALYSILNKF